MDGLLQHEIASNFKMFYVYVYFILCWMLTLCSFKVLNHYMKWLINFSLNHVKMNKMYLKCTNAVKYHFSVYFSVSLSHFRQSIPRLGQHDVPVLDFK